MKSNERLFAPMEIATGSAKELGLLGAPLLASCCFHEKIDLIKISCEMPKGGHD